MHYPNITAGTFLSRPNRFIAQVEIAGKEETCHVKNTGRCRELLVPGAEVYLQREDNPKRKTKYSLIHVQKGKGLSTLIPSSKPYRWGMAASKRFVSRGYGVFAGKSL